MGASGSRAAAPSAPQGWYERVKTQVLLWCCVGVLGLATSLWTPMALLLWWLLPERWGRPLGRAVAHRYFRGYVGLLRATGYVTIDTTDLHPLAGQTPLIVAANHPCLLDALILIAVLPNAFCLMKPTLTHSPLWGAPARLAGYVGGSDFLQVTRDAVQRLREGGQLVIFPEGTRSTPWPLGPLHGGVAPIARRAGVPIQTVIVESNTRFLSKGWPLLRLPPLPLHFRLRRGARIAADTPAAAVVEQLRRQWEDAVGVVPTADRPAPAHGGEARP